MPELKQTSFNEVPGATVAAPGEPHMACVLLLDTSGSMYGDPIDSLNKAINDFKEQTIMDDLAMKRVDVAIIEFNDSARVVQDFTIIPYGTGKVNSNRLYRYGRRHQSCY